jgi:hypothetical protein
MRLSGLAVIAAACACIWSACGETLDACEEYCVDRGTFWEQCGSRSDRVGMPFQCGDHNCETPDQVTQQCMDDWAVEQDQLIGDELDQELAECEEESYRDLLTDSPAGCENVCWLYGCCTEC